MKKLAAFHFQVLTIVDELPLLVDVVQRADGQELIFVTNDDGEFVSPKDQDAAIENYRLGRHYPCEDLN